jgi:trypsin
LKRSRSVVAILLASYVCKAIVVRHDIPDSEYRVDAGDCRTLADLPGEGHGVLIAKQWVVTAAHAVLWRPVHELTLNGVPRPASKVIVHPGYKAAPEALKSGNAEPLMRFMASSDDIALVKLEHPVNDITPAQIYRGTAEDGQMVKIVGSGATGNGLVGEYPDSPHRGQLRRAFSRVISADEKWLGLKFVAPPKAVALEGMPADGDSGAPVFLEVKGSWELAGIVSRKLAKGKISEFICCHYGQITYQIRISRYASWIDSTIATN